MQALTRFVLRHKMLVALTWLLIAVAGVRRSAAPPTG